MGNDHILSELIDIRAILLFNVLNNTYDDCFFFFRQMQRFIHRIIKKTIMMNAVRQRVLQKKIGVKDEQITRPAFHILQVELLHLMPVHRDGPIYMNVSRHLEIPQAAAMAALKAPLKLNMALDGDWDYLTATAKNLGWDEKRLTITIAPPPAGPTPPKEGAGK